MNLGAEFIPCKGNYIIVNRFYIRQKDIINVPMKIFKSRNCCVFDIQSQKPVQESNPVNKLKSKTYKWGEGEGKHVIYHKANNIYFSIFVL